MHFWIFYFVLRIQSNFILFSEKNQNWGGLFTWPKQDDWMNMTKIGEHDQKIDNDEP